MNSAENVALKPIFCFPCTRDLLYCFQGRSCHSGVVVASRSAYSTITARGNVAAINSGCVKSMENVPGEEVLVGVQQIACSCRVA